MVIFLHHCTNELEKKSQFIGKFYLHKIMLFTLCQQVKLLATYIYIIHHALYLFIVGTRHIPINKFLRIGNSCIVISVKILTINGRESKLKKNTHDDVTFRLLNRPLCIKVQPTSTILWRSYQSNLKLPFTKELTINQLGAAVCK